ncbi:MAG: cytochrome P450, partial [Propionibacteriaceae bacterium]|nr:cytochrome P450 [Propionibacteriaceae bacterium]
MTATLEIPAARALTALGGIARHGFLDTVDQLWRTHGDTFRMRLGLGEMVIAVHPDAVREVNLSNRRAFDKRKSYDGVRKYLIGDGLVASTGELWRRQRKLMAPFFTPRGVQAYAEIMLADARRVEERWAGLAASGATIDMGEEMMELTAAIIVRALFGTSADAEVVRLKSCVETMIRFTTRRMGPHLPDWVPTRMGREYARAREEVHAYIRGIIAERRAMADPPTADLLAKLMDARDEDGRPMSESLLRDESITMFFAGHETTARTMAATWAALASAPEVAERLGAELDAVLGDRVPTAADLKSLPYALQVVKEVLRLYPAAPFYVRDAIEATQVQGFEIEEGTPVMLAPYFTHRHPDFWADPERFDPDRFTPEAEAERHPQAYHP